MARQPCQAFEQSLKMAEPAVPSFFFPHQAQAGKKKNPSAPGAVSGKPSILHAHPVCEPSGVKYFSRPYVRLLSDIHLSATEMPLGLWIQQHYDEREGLY